MVKRISYVLLGCLALYFCYNAFEIHRYSRVYAEVQSDVAIVLGAGTNNNKVSPVFRERINHAIYLYDAELVDKIILTGGLGEGQSTSDSRIAMQYAIEQGVPRHDIHIEEKSLYTFQNLLYAQEIMAQEGYNKALIVSDPLHMRRSMLLAEQYGISCAPSPTQTSMYRSFQSKSKSLIYETWFLSLRKCTRFIQLK